MGSEWFFSSWFIHADSMLPREPEWLHEDAENASSREEDGSPEEPVRAPKNGWSRGRR